MNEKSLEQVKELEQLEVIQSDELKVGNAFHAFKFQLGTADDKQNQSSEK